MPVKIKVVGLKELRRDLRKLSEDGAYKPGLRAAGMKAATVVADEARRTAARALPNHAGGVARMGPALGSIRPLASQRGAQVAGGGASYPWFGGDEFGSHGGHRSRQFPTAKEDGYNLYPAIERKRDETAKVYIEAMYGVVKPYFSG